MAHLARQQVFSERIFGPGARTACVLSHIRKEMKEIESQPEDLEEWIDVVLLALDGAWRAGHKPAEIALALAAKQTKNEGRNWPDWRQQPQGQAIEHVRAEGREAGLRDLPSESTPREGGDQQACWLSRLASQASQGASDADVLLDLCASVEAMSMQGFMSDQSANELKGRLTLIAKRLSLLGDQVGPEYAASI